MAAPKARPEFHDPALRQALEEAAPNIEKFTARLDQLSSDIKNLEAYLDRSAVRVAVSVLFAPDKGYFGRKVVEQVFGEYLAWAKGDPERFRIIYYKLQPGEEYPEEVDRNILIEAPLDVRARAKKALPKLLLAVSEAASLGDSDVVEGRAGEVAQSIAGGVPPGGDDDIPF